MNANAPPPPSEGRPQLIAVIDCEEEFDWRYPLRGTPHTLRSTAMLAPLQAIMDRHGLCPTYVVDHAVAADAQAWRPLRDWRERGLCAIGAHLHPWVTPPFEEAANLANSFQANLPPSLERAKIETLVALLEQRFGERPSIFRAGRFGVGDATAATLAALGFTIDASIMPHYSYAMEGGQNFRAAPTAPFWFGPDDALLEIPVTAGFVGAAWRAGPRLQRIVEGRAAEAVHLGGLLSRGGIFARLRLTPEGMRPAELQALVRALLRRGERVFHLTFHSSSAVPGGNPYARGEADCRRIAACLDAFLGFFLGEIGGIATTPHAILAQARARRDSLSPAR